MSLHLAAVADRLLRLDAVRRLPALTPIVRRAAAGQPRAWHLPVAAGTALGLTPEQCYPAAAAVACLQLAIVLVDDILDEDPRGEHVHAGAGPVANYALAFQAAAAEALAAGLSDPQRRALALEAIAVGSSRVAAGQYLDTQPIPDELAYWRVVAEKSAAFFALAFQLGALCSPAPLEVCRDVAGLGALYGEMVQIHDDLRDSLDVPASPDWLGARAPLPILFAATVPHPERARFNVLRSRIALAEPGAVQDLAEAQDILHRSGAISYGLDQILTRDRQARHLLRTLPVSRIEPILTLLDEIVEPVWQLLNLNPAEASGSA